MKILATIAPQFFGLPYDGGQLEYSGSREMPALIRSLKVYQRYKAQDQGDLPCIPHTTTEHDRSGPILLAQLLQRLLSTSTKFLIAGGDQSLLPSIVAALAAKAPDTICIPLHAPLPDLTTTTTNYRRAIVVINLSTLSSDYFTWSYQPQKAGYHPHQIIDRMRQIQEHLDLAGVLLTDMLPYRHHPQLENSPWQSELSLSTLEALLLALHDQLSQRAIHIATPSAHFENLERAHRSGLLAYGGQADAATLLDAYTHGVFPWPIDPQSPLTWFAPDPRGVLFLKDFHSSRSLKKWIRRAPYEIRYNQNFHRVMHECKVAPRGHEGHQSWITDELERGYAELFALGLAYSVECYNRTTQQLVGGLYGVKIGRYISGESMFFKESNCSQLALVHLCRELQEQGIEWIDTQMVTPHMARLGAREITRAHYQELLAQALQDSTQRIHLIGHNIT